MTGYRRLISYIYAYEGEEKGKNIGFVKLESRNGQCRLSVNVKKIYAGGNDIGVYLIASGQEIPLGNIFIRIACPHYIFHIYNGAELATAISYKDISQRDLLT